MKKTTTIYAEALADNRNYKNARMDGKTIGVSESRTWNNAVKALRIPAYAIAQYRHANLANAEIVACDLSPLYTALRTVLDLVGEVNGAKLHAENIAETVIANASRIRTVDISNEMGEARYCLNLANKVANGTVDFADMVLVSTDENRTKFFKKLEKASESEEDMTALVEECKKTVKDLESKPGNCKKLFEISTESAFVKAVEVALGDAINGQCMKSAEQVQAEEEAKRQARRAKTAEKKKAKQAQAKTAA